MSFSRDSLFLHVCILQENLLFSTFILGSVFGDFVVFYGDLMSRVTVGPDVRQQSQSFCTANWRTVGSRPDLQTLQRLPLSRTRRLEVMLACANVPLGHLCTDKRLQARCTQCQRFVF